MQTLCGIIMNVKTRVSQVLQYFGICKLAAHIPCDWSSSIHRMEPVVVGIIMVVGAMTHCALLYFLCDLKAAQMNVQHNLIRGLGHNTAEATKNICCAKVEGKVNHNTVTKKF